jgi:hypothetical protein
MPKFVVSGVGICARWPWIGSIGQQDFLPVGIKALVFAYHVPCLTPVLYLQYIWQI